MRLSLWAAATGAGKGVLDSDAGYIKAEPLLCFKYCLAAFNEGMNETGVRNAIYSGS